MNEIIPTTETDPTLKCNICKHEQEISICRSCQRYSVSNKINRFIDLFDPIVIDEFEIKKGKFFNIRETKNVGVEILIKPDRNKDEIKLDLTILEGIILQRHMHKLLKKYMSKSEEEFKHRNDENYNGENFKLLP